MGFGEALHGRSLTGKYKREKPSPANSRKAEQGTWVWKLTDELFDKLEAIEAEAHDADLTMTQYAIRSRIMRRDCRERSQLTVLELSHLCEGQRTNNTSDLWVIKNGKVTSK